MRRRLVWAVVLACSAVVAVVVFVWFTAPRHRINAETAAQAHDRMTVKELTDLFGVPPGDYTTGPTYMFSDLVHGSGSYDLKRAAMPTFDELEWRSDKYMVRVRYAA